MRQQLAGILRGDVDPLGLLFPDGSLATAEHLYQDAPMLRFANLATQHAMRDVLETYPRGRSLRVLEIGGLEWSGLQRSFVREPFPAGFEKLPLNRRVNLAVSRFDLRWKVKWLPARIDRLFDDPALHELLDKDGLPACLAYAVLAALLDTDPNKIRAAVDNQLHKRRAKPRP